MIALRDVARETFEGFGFWVSVNFGRIFWRFLAFLITGSDSFVGWGFEPGTPINTPMVALNPGTQPEEIGFSIRGLR